ncbi:MAG TPA: YbjN domain-containing protein [Anaeromyxobacteraceae bacterium]|nr:YbjN domain-containing protein [Anaeromyxobacteraceae bacterium]
MKFLSDEGYRPSLEQEGDDASSAVIRFKSEGRTFLALVDLSDPLYLHIELGFSLPEGCDLAMLISAANDLNQSRKVVKTIVDAENKVVEFHAELFLADEAPDAALLQRILGALPAAAEEFFERRCKAPELNA